MMIHIRLLTFTRNQLLLRRLTTIKQAEDLLPKLNVHPKSVPYDSPVIVSSLTLEPNELKQWFSDIEKQHKSFYHHDHNTYYGYHVNE